MKIQNPKVSIVIPVYNGSNFMAQAIDSALAQTYKNLEVVVVNDGSTDNGETDRIAKSYGNKISYYKKENGGVATALNYGIEKMKGDYFSWLSHDDMYEKTKIEEQVKLLSSFDEDNVIAACNTKVLFPNGIKKKDYIDKSTFDYIDIFLSTSAVVGVNGCALLIPKKALDESGGFDPKLPVTQDYDLWFRLKDKNRFVLLEKNLVISRRHPDQDSVQKQKICFDAGEELHRKFLSSVDYSRFESFFKANSRNIESFWGNYIVYKQNGFRKTASMMLKYVLRYYFENDEDKFKETFNSEIGPIVQLNKFGTENTKKKLLFYSNVWHRGGIERVLSIILDHFSDKYDCVLAVNNDNIDDNIGYPIPPSVSYVKINGRDQLTGIMSLVSALDVDLFIGNPNISESFLDVYPMLKEIGIKSIAYNHGYYFLPYMCGEYLYPVALKTKAAYSSADYVVWLTQTGCNIYNIENSNGVYIPNPAVIDPNVLPKKSVNKNVLAVGRFDDEIKQIDKILLVFKELHKIDPEYHLDIVGHCEMDFQLPGWGNMLLKDFIAQKEIPVDSITFHGEQKKVSKYYDNASFLILTSRCEGFGMVFLEALSRGLPCTSFEYLGVEELVQNGYNGWVHQRDDYLGLAQNIARTIKNEKQFVDMSQNARDSVNQYDVRNYYDRWEKLIQLATSKDEKIEQALLPVRALTTSDYRRITLEYERLLKDVASDYLTKEVKLEATVEEPESPSKINDLKTRLKVSIGHDGVFLTGEKIVRKVHTKYIKRRR